MFAQRRYPSHLHSPIVLVRKNLVDLWRNPVGDPFKSHDVACQGSRTIVELRTARDAGSQPPLAEGPSTGGQQTVSNLAAYVTEIARKRVEG